MWRRRGPLITARHAAVKVRGGYMGELSPTPHLHWLGPPVAI